MKGSAFKLGNVATKSALKDRKSNTKRNDKSAHHGGDHQHNWDKNTEREVYPEDYPETFEKKQYKLNERRKTQEQAKKIDKSAVPMKSPMMQIEPGTCAVCGGTREQHAAAPNADHGYRMGQAESMQDSKDKREVEMGAERAELIEKYGSWEAAVEANEQRIAENTNKGPE